MAAIWLSPFYRSPMADFGYDISDYTDVDPVFGTLADFDDLLAGGHGRGVKVIVDWVPQGEPSAGTGHESGSVFTSLRAVASSVGPAPNDGHHRATPHAPHAGLRA